MSYCDTCNSCMNCQNCGGCGSCGFDCGCGCVGPRGPRGERGPSGHPAFFAGISAQLKTGTTIAAGASIRFDTILTNRTPDITYTAGSGDFIVSRPGLYQVIWMVNAKQATACTAGFGVELNGTVVAAQDVYVSRGQICGTALIWVTTETATLRIVNSTASTTVTYDTETTVLANVVITQTT